MGGKQNWFMPINYYLIVGHFLSLSSYITFNWTFDLNVSDCALQYQLVCFILTKDQIPSPRKGSRGLEYQKFRGLRVAF